MTSPSLRSTILVLALAAIALLVAPGCGDDDARPPGGIDAGRDAGSIPGGDSSVQDSGREVDAGEASDAAEPVLDAAEPEIDAGVIILDAGPGACTADGECARGEYCERPIGMCTGLGVCTVEPMICTRIYMPVCGCDGMTYSNRCVAQAAGMNVDHVGECAM